MTNPLISVVTLTHNHVDYSRRCLGSLLRTAYSPWELVVVDNGSTDGTRAWLKEFEASCAAAGVRLSILLNDGNVGCSTARNQGVARARGDKVVFVDNDVALRSRGWLARLGAVLDRERDAAFVGPKIVYPFPPHEIQCAGVGVARSGRVQFMGRGEAKDDPRFGVRRAVQCLISACMMGKKSVLDRIGGFDEAFNPVEFEDLDLCYRARSQGYRVFYEPGVEMYHFESVTTSGTATLPNTYLIIKHGMLFKERWRHMFEHEKGPEHKDTRWKQIASRRFDEVGELASIE